MHVTLLLLLLVLLTLTIQGFLLPDTCLEVTSSWSCKCGKSMKADEVGWDKVVEESEQRIKLR